MGVVLLHAGMQDSRLWGPLVDRLDPATEVTLVDTPAPALLGREPWCEAMSEHAREALRGRAPVTLVVSAADSAGSAVDLVAEGLAERALLIEPDTGHLFGEMRELIMESVDPAELARPVPDPEAEPEPSRGEELSARFAAGTLTAEEVPELAAVWLDLTGDDDDLDPAASQLAREVALEQFTAWWHRLDGAVPLVAEPSADRSWVTVAAPLGKRITFAFGDREINRFQSEVLRRHLPDASLVTLPTTSGMPWLQRPELIASLVADLVAAAQR